MKGFAIVLASSDLYTVGLTEPGDITSLTLQGLGFEGRVSVLFDSNQLLQEPDMRIQGRDEGLDYFMIQAASPRVIEI